MDKNANPQYYYVHMVGKGDLANEQIYTFGGMNEEKVYLLNSDNNNMDSMVNDVSKYLEIIKKTVVTNLNAPNHSSIDHIAIYPYPANETFTIESSNSEISYCKLYNSTGKWIKTLIIENGINTYNISALKSGLYFIHLQNEDGIIVKKLVVN